MPSQRAQKVAGLIKTEISDIIQTRIKDPLVGFVTITDVSLSDDLRTARVYFSVLGDDAQKDNSLKGLNRAKSFIQNELGTRVRLRYLPILQFFIDESWNYGERIEDILKNLQLDDTTTDN